MNACIYKYNLLSPLSVGCMSVCVFTVDHLGWDNLWGVLRKGDRPPPNLGAEPCEILSLHINMSTAVIVQVLV